MRGNKMKRLIVLFFLIAMAAENLSAENTAAAFLKLGSGAKAQGFAGAYSAIIGDIDAIAYNPAGINGIKKSEFSLTYTRLENNLNYNFAGYGIALKKGIVGLAVNYLSNTGIEGRGANREATGNFGASDIAVNLSYGRILDRLGLGLNVKYIKSAISGMTAQSYAFDMGVICKTGVSGLNLGFSIQNIGTKMKFLNQSNTLPLILRTGVSYTGFGNVMLSIEADRFIHEKKTTISVGIGYTVLNNVAIRAGYLKNFEDKNIKVENSISGGFGLKMNKFTFEYALVPFGEFGNSQRLSLGIKF